VLVRFDERVPIVRLLQFLEQGERLARDCAKAQAALAGDERASRFLLGQSRQEAFHAVVFQGAIRWLMPRHVGGSPLLPPLERYRRLLEAALAEKNFAETLLAEQIVLEGLGEAILKRIERGLEKRGAACGPIRRLLIHQEEAHHAFGRRMLERAIDDGRASAERLRAVAPQYVELVDAMLVGVADLFDTIREDPRAWAADAKGYLPLWLQGGET
jgi:hypothetical protein